MLPATDKQKKYLTNLNISFSPDITAEDASRLIGGNFPAEDYQKSILKYFKITFEKNIDQTSAGDLITNLFKDKNKESEWKNKNNKKALKEQLIILKFFGVEIPKYIDLKSANKMVNNIFDDPDNENRWEEHLDKLQEEEDKIEDRKEAIADVLEEFNFDKNDFYCKRISKKIFTQFVEEMEPKGYTLEQIGDIKNYDTFFPMLLNRFPELRK